MYNSWKCTFSTITHWFHDLSIKWPHRHKCPHCVWFESHYRNPLLYVQLGKWHFELACFHPDIHSFTRVTPTQSYRRSEIMWAQNGANIKPLSMLVLYSDNKISLKCFHKYIFQQSNKNREFHYFCYTDVTSWTHSHSVHIWVVESA